MIDLYTMYQESQQDGQVDGGLFLTKIKSKLESIKDIPAGKDDIKDQEFSKKEIVSLLNFFIYLADCHNKLASLSSPGLKDAKKGIILQFFVDDQGGIEEDAALKKISSRIDQLLEFSSEEGKISIELLDEINKNINSYARQTSGEEVLDQHAASSLSDISLEIASSASHSNNKHGDINYYITEYNEILAQEEEFAEKLNEKEQNNLSPEKYSGIGASVKMTLNAEGKITGFKVLSVVKNSHAQVLGLKQDDTLQLNAPVKEDEINAIVHKIRNLDLSDLYIVKDDIRENLKIPGTPSPRRQFFSTKDKIQMISADEAGIVTVARQLNFDGAVGTPGASPSGTSQPPTTKDSSR